MSGHKGEITEGVTAEIEGMIEQRRFAIGGLHSLGHELECQIQFNVLRKENIGRTAGEEAERVNSRTGRSSLTCRTRE